jgi:hypothetical protein
MPITLIASLIDHHTLDPMQPSNERRGFFRSITSMEYSPPVTPDLSSTRDIQCPFCVDHNEFSTSYWNASGTGWAQPNFKGVCPYCHQQVIKENMGVRKLCDELALKQAGGRVFFSYVGVVEPSGPCFDLLICSETLLDPYTGVENEVNANIYMQSLMKVGLHGSHHFVC